MDKYLLDKAIKLTSVHVKARIDALASQPDVASAAPSSDDIMLIIETYYDKLYDFEQNN